MTFQLFAESLLRHITEKIFHAHSARVARTEPSAAPARRPVLGEHHFDAETAEARRGRA